MDLRVSFHTADGVVAGGARALLRRRPGSTLAIVGESGSGKSVATQTITGLTRGAQVSGSARFDGTDLLIGRLADVCAGAGRPRSA